jgi:hypothetical protein
MSVAIKVENLSKRFLIRHQRRERYATLRDSLTSGAGRLIGRLNWKAARDPETEEEFWALRDVDFEIRQGERGRHHRPQWRRQVHPAEDTFPYHRPRRPGAYASPARWPVCWRLAPASIPN